MVYLNRYIASWVVLGIVIGIGLGIAVGGFTPIPWLTHYRTVTVTVMPPISTSFLLIKPSTKWRFKTHWEIGFSLSNARLVGVA